MAIYILLAILAAITILILLAKITVRLRLCEDTVIDFDFFFFGLSIFPMRKNSGERRKKRRISKRFSGTVRKAAATRRALEYLFTHSKVTVHDLKIHIEEDEPSKFVLKSNGILFLISLFLTYLYIKTETLTGEERILITNDSERESSAALIDVSFKTSVIHALVSLAMFKINELKRKKKRKKYFVGNENG